MGAFRGLFVRKDATRGTQPAEARKALAGLFAPVSAIGARAGVLYGPGEPLKVTGTASWQYQVNAGHLVSSRGDVDGVVLFGSDGTALTPAVAAAPGSGSRWDLIYLRQQQVDAGGGETSDASLGVVSGAASGTPVKPAVPAGAVVLAEALVSAGATSTAHANVTISQVALYTAVRGVPLPVRSQAERDALTAFDGLSVKRLDLGGVQEDYVSGAWRGQNVDDTGWLALPLATGWSAYGGSPGLQVPQYRRVKVGSLYEVMWRGVGKKSGVIANGETIATMPAGFRPPAGEVFNVMGNGPTAATGRLDVYADGTVKVMNAGFDGAYLSFAKIRYFTS